MYSFSFSDAILFSLIFFGLLASGIYFIFLTYRIQTELSGIRQILQNISENKAINVSSAPEKEINPESNL